MHSGRAEARKVRFVAGLVLRESRQFDEKLHVQHLRVAEERQHFRLRLARHRHGANHKQRYGNMRAKIREKTVCHYCSAQRAGERDGIDDQLQRHRTRLPHAHQLDLSERLDGRHHEIRTGRPDGGDF